MNGKLVTASDTEQSFRSNTTAVILAKPTQPSTPSGTENEYRPKCGDTLLLGSKGRFRQTTLKLEMWANAQRDGRPAEYRWHPLFNAAVWLTPTTRLPCSNAAKTRNPLKVPGVPQTNERISAASEPKFTIL